MKENINKYLKSHGISALLGFNVSAYMFLGGCLFFGIFAVVCMSVFNVKNIFVCILGFIIGLFCPVIFLNISNQSDNEKMLTDIRNIFEMLKIQAHAGVYIVDAIENCEKKIKSKRLKTAVDKLLSSIYMSQEITLTLDEFNSSFDNKYIDTLVIIIKQAMESGYSVNQLDSGFEQMLDVENAICIKKENSTERNTQLLQVMFMAGIIAMAVFCSIVEFKGIFEIL